jgi:hypothetical protein
LCPLSIGSRAVEGGGVYELAPSMTTALEDLSLSGGWVWFVVKSKFRSSKLIVRVRRTLISLA